MTFDGALVREQGVTFGIVVVKPHILHSRNDAVSAIAAFQPVFPGVPIVLMAQDSRGVPTYYGRNDIVQFLASIDCARIPWKQYTINN